MWIVSCNNRFLCQESRNVAHVHLYCIDKQALVLWDGDCQLPFITDPSLAGRKASRKQGSTLRPRIFSFPETWNSSGSASFQHICRRVVSTYFFQTNLPTKSIYLLNSSRENHLLVTHFLPLTKHTLKNQRQQTSQQKSQQKHPEPTELEGKTHRQAVVKSVLHLQGAGPSAGPAARAVAEAEELAWPDAAACRFEDLKVWNIRIISCERVGFVSKRCIDLLILIIKF